MGETEYNNLQLYTPLPISLEIIYDHNTVVYYFCCRIFCGTIFTDNQPKYYTIVWLSRASLAATGIFFFLYCFISSLSMRWHIDAFLSPWGGWRTKLPLSISDYQQIEWMFFFFGNAAGLLVMAWWGLQHGFLMLVLHITLSIPRLLTVLRVQKWKKEQKGFVVKHEKQGIGLYSTFG